MMMMINVLSLTFSLISHTHTLLCINSFIMIINYWTKKSVKIRQNEMIETFILNILDHNFFPFLFIFCIYIVSTGTCLPIYGVNEGDSCTDDGDCETGLRCMPQTILIFNENNNDGRSLPPSSQSQSSSIINSHQQHQIQNQKERTCQPPGQEMLKKQFSKFFQWLQKMNQFYFYPNQQNCNK